MAPFWWAVLTSVIWGICPLLEKQGLANMPPALGLMVRCWGVVAGMLLLACTGLPWPHLRAVPWSHLVLLASGGFLASVAGQMLFYQALRAGAVSQVIPVAGAYPLVTALLGWCVLREPITVPRVLGVLCIVMGVILLRK